MLTVEKEEPTKIAEHTPEQPKEPYEIMVEQLVAGLKEHHRSNIGLVLSSFSAGLEVGFSILTIGIIYTLFKTEVSPSKLYIMMALVYPIGYIFVIIGRSELFTEHTVLATISVLISITGRDNQLIKKAPHINMEDFSPCIQPAKKIRKAINKLVKKRLKKNFL